MGCFPAGAGVSELGRELPWGQCPCLQGEGAVWLRLVLWVLGKPQTDFHASGRNWHGLSEQGKWTVRKPTEGNTKQTGGSQEGLPLPPRLGRLLLAPCMGSAYLGGKQKRGLQCPHYSIAKYESMGLRSRES